MFLVIVYISAVSSALEVEAGVSLGEPWGGQASHISLRVMLVLSPTPAGAVTLRSPH